MMHDAVARTTVTLDPAAQLVRRRMRERGISFKQAINHAIRAGSMAFTMGERFRTEKVSKDETAPSIQTLAAFDEATAVGLASSL
jgi:hypothetical protein